MPSLTRHDGELTIDHRASPGLTPEEARAVGLGGIDLGEGRVYSGATLGCNHCGGVVVLNPHRQRAREYCRHCDHYICDFCYATTTKPDYVHRTIAQLTDLVQSGRWEISGPASDPIITRIHSGV